MKTPFKPVARLIAVAALCAALAACSQPSSPSANVTFPSYGGQAAAGQFVAPSIMDY